LTAANKPSESEARSMEIINARIVKVEEDVKIRFDSGSEAIDISMTSDYPHTVKNACNALLLRLRKDCLFKI
jgi:hypothetical protein